MNRGEIRAAVAELQRADGLQPDMPETLLELGKAMALSGEPDTAVQWLEQASTLRPRDPRRERLATQAHDLREKGNGSPPLPIP